MREAEKDVRMIGSNSNPDCVYKMVCDEWYTEPKLKNNYEYVNYCLEFCFDHKIDIFVPRHNLTSIIKYKKQFEEIGTKLLANTDLEGVAITDNKIDAYNYLKSKGINDIVPEFYKCKNLMEFQTAFSELSQKGYKVCYKLAIDEGALTYHVIEKSRNKSIYKSSSSHLSYEESLDIFRNYSFKFPLLVMPYMDEPEISVDCLNSKDGLILIPRYKLGGRISEVRFDNKIMMYCRDISEYFNFDMPYNIQYRFLNGKPMLLELNPRMSGGLQLSCRATNINIPAIALSKLLGKNFHWNHSDFYNRKVAHIETPIIIE
jgi:carbamoylphosphate synthase large subunit